MDAYPTSRPVRAKRQGDRPARVLIVDDEYIAREGYRAMLQGEGIEIAGTAANGVEAVRSTGVLRPDVVLMDVRMPQMDGLSATRQIKKLHPEVAVLIVSDQESPTEMRDALAAGASGYILKTTSRSGLINAIATLAGGESVVEARLLPALFGQMTHSSKAAPQSPLETLTEREMEVLRLIASGLTNREIAGRMHYSVGTVKNVVQQITEKLRVADRTQAAVLAVRAGMKLSQNSHAH